MSDAVYRVQETGRQKQRLVVHFDRLKPCAPGLQFEEDDIASQATSAPPPAVDDQPHPGDSLEVTEEEDDDGEPPPHITNPETPPASVPPPVVRPVVVPPPTRYPSRSRRQPIHYDPSISTLTVRDELSQEGELCDSRQPCLL